jgi:hypothetical protein
MPTERNKEGKKERQSKYEKGAGRDGERKQTTTGRLKERVESTGCVSEQDVEEGTLKRATNVGEV